MNDYLQNILNNDISDLKKEFPLFETADSIEAHQARQQRAHTQLWRSNPDEDSSELTETSSSLSKALVTGTGEGRSTGTLDVIQLEPISIVSEKKNPQIVNVKQTFRFPNNFITKKNSFHGCGNTSRRPVVPRNMYSQTSKTIVELYDAQKRENEVRQILTPHRSEGSESELSLDERSNPVRSCRNASYTVVNDSSKKPHHKSNARPVDMVMIKPKSHRTVAPTTPYFATKKKRPPSKRKYTRSIRSRDRFSLPAVKSPKRKARFPSSKAEVMSDELKADKVTYEDDSLNTTSESSNPSNDSLGDDCSTFGEFQITKLIDKLQDHVWEVSLQGIRELMDTANQIDWKKHEKHMTIINRKMIDFLKSPRSSLCRSACQAAGELFREAKSTKRPEFDEIVDILLCKTADPNRFIQKDANVALDKLVTYIPISHSVRALSARGPIHKNPLVRTATARLLVCICALSGLDAILGTNANPRTRKAILSMLAKFLTDKNLETRKFGERMYKMLRKHKFFNEYFYKDMDSNCKNNLKRMLKGI
ncbi:uncharacterized protein LOC5563844 [Aedes aegypti]|uniref:TOG domain-containing protein n=1 Tax=Aedes aegypti TaxID=7159 RepID=A0A1S4G1N2_AEDAE|nr:uncharacterized protein LOC5563844 [Aedes aegypti]